MFGKVLFIWISGSRDQPIRPRCTQYPVRGRQGDPNLGFPFWTPSNSGEPDSCLFNVDPKLRRTERQADRTERTTGGPDEIQVPMPCIRMRADGVYLSFLWTSSDRFDHWRSDGPQRRSDSWRHRDRR